MRLAFISVAIFLLYFFTAITSQGEDIAVGNAPGIPRRQPNILHIHADDHRPDGLHALGMDLLKTPNLDELVVRGMTFSHCYTMGSMVGAVCTPSRTMLLTGRSWQHLDNKKSVKGDKGADRKSVV